MLTEADGQLRWASASDQRAQTLEDNQEVFAAGPCAEAFNTGRPAVMHDASLERRWGEITLVFVEVQIRSGLSVPVELGGGPIGTLDVYSAEPRGWDDTTGSLSRRSTETHPTRRSRRPLHWASRVDFPYPGGATTQMTGAAGAASSRSTSAVRDTIPGRADGDRSFDSTRKAGLDLHPRSSSRPGTTRWSALVSTGRG
jgi:hypothetical protein